MLSQNPETIVECKQITSSEKIPHFGRLIHAARMLRGLTQADLVKELNKRTGTSHRQDFISKVERGEIPAAEKTDMFATILGIDLAVLQEARMKDWAIKIEEETGLRPMSFVEVTADDLEAVLDYVKKAGGSIRFNTLKSMLVDRMKKMHGDKVIELS